MTHDSTPEDHDDESWINALNSTLRELREIDIERALANLETTSDCMSPD